MNKLEFLTVDEVKNVDTGLVKRVTKTLAEKNTLHSKEVTIGGVVFKFFSSVNNTILGSFNDYGKSLGGIRVMDYANLDVLDREAYAKFDATNLGRSMARKWAILNFMGTQMYQNNTVNDKELRSFYMGGGKSVIYVRNLKDYFNLSGQNRVNLFKTFGKFLEEEVKGDYMGGEDMNTLVSDMDTIKSETKYISCFHKELGGSGNPSPVTAEGVYRYMLGLVPKLFNKNSLDGLTIGIQGVGNVGAPLAEKIRRDFPDAKLIFTTLDTQAGIKLAEKLNGTFVSPDQIIGMKMDIFSPNAGSEVLNESTIPKLISAGVKLVCGGANCQFKVKEGKIDHKLAQQCAQADVYVAPDYPANLGGILNLSFEFPIPENEHSLKKAEEIASGNTHLAAEIYDMSEKYNMLPYECADYLADHVIAAFLTKNIPEAIDKLLA